MKKYVGIVLSLTLLTTQNISSESSNLESYKQDFIVKTKQITIPGFPGAFNASIIRWQGSLLLCFRVRNEKLVSTFDIGFVQLDEDFNPVGTPSILKIIDENPACRIQRQDPRLIICDNKLYILYSNFIKIGNILTRRMFIAPVRVKDHNFSITKPTCLHPFDGCGPRWEKNWVPFVYRDNIFLAYSLLPHRIFRPFLRTGECVTYTTTRSKIEWKWGDLRGGTPAIKDGDHYIAFFHSSVVIPTVHSQGKPMTHYVMGAYTFAAQPPFEITSVSPYPIVDHTFYTGPSHQTWKPLRVVFPMGILVEKDYVYVTYGRQDFEIWVAKMDKNKLYKSLVTCPKAEAKEINEDTDQLDIEGFYQQYVALDENS